MLGLAGVSELKPDLDHLLRKEQHLERAYRKLLEHVQQHARESAVENLEIAFPKPKVLTTGQSSANLCPALIASSGFYGQEMVNLYPQTSVAETGDLIDFSAEEEQPDEPPAEELLLAPKFTVLCPAPTVASAFLREKVVGLSPKTMTGTCDFLPAVSMELQQTSPAEDLVTEQRVEDICSTLLAIPETGDLIDVSVEEEPSSKPPEVLATGQRVQDLCPTPAAILEAQGEKAVITSQLQLDLVSVDGPVASTNRKPAEVLATGQSATNLCPAPATTAEFQGAGTVGLSPQQLAGADNIGMLLRQAKSLATGQSAVGFCLAPSVSSQLQGNGTVGPSAQQQAKPWNVKHHPAEALTDGQRVNDLCLTPTEVNYSLQPRKEIMRTDFVSSLCLTNACPDQVEVWDLVSQLLMGEKCDRLTRDRGFWRGL
ncbi:hypothetical protein AB205_0132170, partial [Aquarana catesbeiana]